MKATACILFFLTGCSLPQQTVTIKVPVPVKCSVPAVELPSFPVDALSGIEDPFVIGKSLWATIEIQDAHIKELRQAAKVCE